MKGICIIGLILLGIVQAMGQMPAQAPAAGQPLRVGVAGLNHDHVRGLMNSYKEGKVIILGIAESDAALVARYKQQYHLPDSIFYPSVTVMLEHTKPDAVLAYNAVSDHLAVVEACAPQGVSVMVEKPLTFSVKQADRMAALVGQFHIRLLTNYETTWYASSRQIYAETHTQHKIGDIRRMVARDGHQGPVEIGCSADFLKWLTDPEKNGGGASIDFGCYGADLMTWLMDGKAPIAVTAITRHYKAAVYPKVDDDASILLEYPDATGLIEASWNWPFGIKDFQVFGQGGWLFAPNGNALEEKMHERDSMAYVDLDPPSFPGNSLDYLAAVLRGELQPEGDASSLETNLVVVRILDAALRSAREGKRIVMGH